MTTDYDAALARLFKEQADNPNAVYDEEPDDTLADDEEEISEETLMAIVDLAKHSRKVAASENNEDD